MSTTGWPTTTISAVLAGLETARVTDFVRYVSRIMRERPELETFSFKDGWNIMLGGYGEMIARHAEGEPDDAA